MFQIINNQTKQIAGNRKTRTAARRLVDKLDNQHGGYIHQIVDMPEVKEVMEAEYHDVQGVCKDCGHGTLNNRLNPAFDVSEDSVACSRCHSTHIDVLSF